VRRDHDQDRAVSGVGNTVAAAAAEERRQAPMTTALVCDERRTVREMLLKVVSAVESVESIESVASGTELLASYNRQPTDIVLVGTQRALTTGVEAVRQLLMAHPSATVMVFGSPDDASSIAAAIAAGARGFLRWDATHPELLMALSDTVTTGGAPTSRAAAEGGPSLTERELQVLQGMSRGQSNGEIGEELFLSEDTIKTHARRLFKKLGARDRAHAVAVGFRRGFVA
jgi:DNA-binding NarL/FixJ family response regulator